jgi:CDP-4-dehydro-6-deoxyglucose reductase
MALTSGDAMTQWLSLSRAVHLTGMSRGALQRKIHTGELAAFDGMVSADALAQAFPDLAIEARLDEAGAFERVTRIKEESFGRRVRERVLPSQELLAQRLFLVNQELAEQRRILGRADQWLAAADADVEAARQRGDGALPLEAVQQLLEQAHRALHPVASGTGPDAQLGTNPITLMDQLLRTLTARVTLLPAGREFLVEGNDTLLEAALKAGLSPSYGCGNGNCGLCKARVRSGQVQAVRHSDYLLSQTEREQGNVLMCTHRPLTDLTLEALDASAAADIPQQELVATVRAVTPLDADTLLLHLQTPRSHRLRFLAGQGLTLGLAGEQHDFAADYLIASCPCDDRNLHFHVRRDAADALATRLFAGALKPGTPVNLRGPWGDFVLTHDDERPLVFIAAGHGFAPVKGLIEHAMAAQTCESIHLVWSADPGGHYLARQVRAWADALDGFHAALPEAGCSASAATFVRQALGSTAPTLLAQAQVYLAGPTAFVDAVAQALPEVNPADLHRCAIDRLG